MFRNYLKTAVRFFANNKGFSLLNIAGLSIGTICCIYILVYVREQYSYDRWFSDAARIYRVTSSLPAGHGTYRPQATTPPSLGTELEKEFPHLLATTRVIPTVGCEKHFLSAGAGTTNVQDAYMVDSNFFQLLDFHFTAGRADSALALPHSVVLLQTVADRLFGKEDPMGREIWVQNGYGNTRYVVGGVIDESRGRSSIHADLFIRINPDACGNGVLEDSHWAGRYFAYTFIKMNPGWSGKDIEKRLTGGLHLQPIGGMHMTDGYDSEMGRTVSGVFLAILIGLAALIQLIACINFMNLATARGSRRAKEVGVRKVVGADNKGLIFQFLMESFLLSLAAVLIVLPLLIICFPWLNKATGADIPKTVFAEPAVWCLLPAIAVVTGLLAGSYPAFYLSAFQATKVIKGDLGSPFGGARMRRSLVVFQFILSIVLIVSMIVIRRQLDFIRNKDLGFYKDGQIVFSFDTYGARRTANYFATDIRQLPEVRDACLTDNYPGALSYQSTRIYLKDSDPAMAAKVNTVNSDEHFLKTMGISLISGRDLTFNDTGSVIINQSMAQRLGLEPGNAPGTRLLGWDGARYTIAGVMKDFNYQSLHENVSPFMVVYRPTGVAGFDHLIVSASTTRYSSLLSKIKAMWDDRVFVGHFYPEFLTDKIQLLYKTEIVLSRIIESFSVMAILISCLGLFGLAAFNAEQRTREIGIRKVMGASVTGIVRLLTGDFLKLISISFFVAVPIGWWVMNKWLGIFIYHIDVPWWTFSVAGGVTILIGMSVVCWQAARAAVVNPVESLRTS